MGKKNQGSKNSKRAGLIFPVGRIRRMLRKGQYKKKISPGAAVYMAATLEYLVAEWLELAGNAAKDNRRQRIIPRHLSLAVFHDEEFSRLLQGVTISEGGVLPNIEKVLLPKRTQAKMDA